MDFKEYILFILRNISKNILRKDSEKTNSEFLIKNKAVIENNLEF